MKFYFKSTFLGMVLMVEDRKPGLNVGEWKYFWRKATPQEASKFTYEIEISKHKLKSLKNMQEKFPQYFI